MSLRNVDDELKYNPKAIPAKRKVQLKKRETVTVDHWEKTKQKSTSKGLIILLALSTLFFLGSIGIAIVINVFDIDRSISSEKIDIFLDGGQLVSPDTNSTFNLKIVNRNPVDISTSKIVISYPSGTYEKTQDGYFLAKSKEIPVGSIKANSFKDFSFNAFFYGENEEKKTIDINYTYQTTGTLAKFEKKESINFILNGKLFSFSQPRVENITSGKKFNLNLKVIPNIKNNFKFVFVTAQYPINFTPTGLSPTPILGTNNEWEFNNVSVGQALSINISGILIGQPGLEKGIIFSVYGSRFDNSKENAILFASSSTSLLLQNAFLDAKIQTRLSKETLPHFTKTEFAINWNVNGNRKYKDVVFVLTLKGNGLDESALNSKFARYDANTKQFIFDKTSYEQFDLISPNDSGTLLFNIGSVPAVADFANKNKTILLSLAVSGIDVLSGETLIIDRIDNKEIKLRNALNVDLGTYFYNTKIKNTGIHPPEIGRQTTYTLKYIINNFGNDLSNVKLTIPLSKDAEFTGITKGILENEIEYDSDTKIITINIRHFSGIGKFSTRTLELQVVARPSIADKTKFITLTKLSNFSGEDTFLSETYIKKLKPLNTDIKDINFKPDEEDEAGTITE